MYFLFPKQKRKYQRKVLFCAENAVASRDLRGAGFGAVILDGIEHCFLS